MKTASFSVLVALLILILVYNCEDEPNEEKSPSEITGQLIKSSECKFQKAARLIDETPDSLSCVEYSLDEANHILSMTHINAGFNCCPGDLSCTVTMSGDTIIIAEHEEESSCDCNCLFDLEIELEGVMSEKYIVKFIEPYVFEEAPILFEMDITETNEGSYCVTRKGYPWGMSLY